MRTIERTITKLEDNKAELMAAYRQEGDKPSGGNAQLRWDLMLKMSVIEDQIETLETAQDILEREGV